MAVYEEEESELIEFEISKNLKRFGDYLGPNIGRQSETLVKGNRTEGGVVSMKDTTKLLNFNPDRNLQFNVFRDVDFQMRRNLTFNIDRELTFDSERELTFGKKGVSFRHFACGRCGEVVEGDAIRCPNCGVVFEVEEESIGSDTRVRLSEEIEHSKMKQYFGEEYKERVRSETRGPTYRCGSCGKLLRYIRERGKWYCDRCKIFIGVTPRGAPKTYHRFTSHAGGGPGGVKFIETERRRPPRSGEVVIVEDLNRRRRRQIR